MSDRTPERLTQSDLDQFTGTTAYHRHFTGLLYTDGIHFLAETAGAYWLIDLVASYQNDKRVAGNQRLQEFQLWTLSVADGRGVVQLREDSGCPVVLEQEIEFTDFPLDSIRLYVESGEGPLLLLPSEH